VEIDELVREAIAPHAARAAERKLELQTELAQVSRDTDRDKLRVVLDNLVENATTYANEGGTVRIELTATGIVVSNTGCTIAKDDVARVFDRFWRGDKARSSGTHGGVGLALCKKLVELLDGTITAERVGDRFVITITWRA
jgi:signal transduction histidine kinase